jgi:ribulose-5-phosphate 4-epimerase/fuculose-1-phosphate aldolase
MYRPDEAELGAAREQLISYGNRLLSDGLALGSAGNISVRLGDTVLITPSSVPYPQMRPEQMCELRLAPGADVTRGPGGVPLTGGAGGVGAAGRGAGVDAAREAAGTDSAGGGAGVSEGEPGLVLGGMRLAAAPPPATSSETPMHLAIYASSPAGAVVHTHSPEVIALSAVFDKLPAIHYAIHALGGTVRVAPYTRFGSEGLAQAAVLALDGRRAAILANHGAICYGKTLAQAYDNALLLEWLARTYRLARMLGEPAILTDEQLEEVGAEARRRRYGREQAEAQAAGAQDAGTQAAQAQQ